MKSSFLWIITVLACIKLPAQDKVYNDMNVEVRSIEGPFHSITVENGIELVIKQGNTEAIAVSAAKEEHRKKIKAEVKNGILKIYYHSDVASWGMNKEKKQLKAYVSLKDIDRLDASSRAHTNIDGELNCNELKVGLSSGASIKGKINAAQMSVDQSSGSNMKVTGMVKSLEVESSSGAEFFGYELITDNCDADASSGSHIEINVNNNLKADASSGGGIYYKGNGSISKISTSSGGSVRKKS